MKALGRAMLAALVLIASACNSDALPPASGFTTIQGTVVDGASNKPVAGAVVTVDTILTATTDASGKFSIDKVPSGIVDYTVQANGYSVVSSSANVEPGKPYELDLTLAATNH
ncbi:MAG: carboxypeptidase regulatory-like domain-containing protein [Candidatus Eremiobacteraeota bacterium]|nr:carboxypeptidase regulatory-like domain-containing protein [Candidatus Eremiobacteraeota bacterium]